MALQVGHLHPLPHSTGVIMSSRRIGNYQITDYVGSGGFGSVFKAEDINTPGRVVAIKELHKKHTRNQVIKQRFFQEAVAMARLDHRDGLLKEALLDDLIARMLLVKLLYGNHAARRVDVFGLKDGAEPAAAYVIRDLIIANASAAHNHSGRVRERM